MPPYSKLSAFMVEKYRAIASSDEASIDQKLRALGHLEKLQVKRKPKGKKTAGSFKKGHIPKNKTPKASDSKLLGVVPADVSSLSDAALLGLVENVEPLAEPLQPVGPALSAAASEAVVDVVQVGQALPGEV